VDFIGAFLNRWIKKEMATVRAGNKAGDQMKAVLEFSYPDDEHKLLCALKSTDMFKALTNIRGVLETSALCVPKLQTVEEIVDAMLCELEGLK
jgi:hypothetical protein